MIFLKILLYNTNFLRWCKNQAGNHLYYHENEVIIAFSGMCLCLLLRVCYYPQVGFFLHCTFLCVELKSCSGRQTVVFRIGGTLNIKEVLGKIAAGVRGIHFEFFSSFAHWFGFFFVLWNTGLSSSLSRRLISGQCIEMFCRACRKLCKDGSSLAIVGKLEGSSGVL